MNTKQRYSGSKGREFPTLEEFKDKIANEAARQRALKDIERESKQEETIDA